MKLSFDRDRRRGVRLSIAALVACAATMLLAATASATPNWLDPADLSKPGRNATNPAVAMDGAGNTVAVWERQSVTDSTINLQMSTRAPGGSFTAPVDFALKATEPRVAMAPSGAAVVVWKHFENPPGTYVILASSRPPGGTFGPPSLVYTAEPGVIPQQLEVAIGDRGDIVVTWSRIDPNSGLDQIICGYSEPGHKPFNCRNPSFVEASVRPAGAGFTPAARISPPRGTAPGGETPQEKLEREQVESQLFADEARPAVDAAGNAIVVWPLYDGKDTIVQGAVREAGASFAAPVQVSPAGGEVASPEIGVDAAGNALVTWALTEGATHAVEVSVRPPGGSFSLLGAVSAFDEGMVDGPKIAVAPNGAATILWRASGLSEAFLQTATRPAGGSFGPPVNVSSGKDNPLFWGLAADGAGDAVVVWSGDNGANKISRAAARIGGDEFAKPVAISQSSADYFHPQVAGDVSGNATVTWVRDDGTYGIVQDAGFDPRPPDLFGVVTPSVGKVGDPLQFSASASAFWGVAKPGFNFGDGATATGDAVSHAYSAPGHYLVTVTATDAAGRTTTSQASLLIKARNYFKVSKLRLNGKKGTATLAVTIPEPGAIAVSGKGIKKTKRAAKAGSVTVPIVAVGKGLKRLDKNGKLKARLKIAYSPVGGDTSSQQHKVTLRKKPS